MKPQLKSQKQFKSVVRSSLGSLIALLVLAPQAGALTIKRNFIEMGELFPGVGNLRAGDAPSNTAGSGNLWNIFNAAADWWEATILDDFDLTLNFGWGARDNNTLATEFSIEYGGTPHRVQEGTIIFDNDESTEWFLDPTPLLPDEYQDFVTDATDLGRGRINVERRYTTPVTDSNAAGKFDLFQTALHEIGHALGLDRGNEAYIEETKDNKIDVTSPRPFRGSDIPVNATSAHLGGSLNNSLMWPNASTNERRIPSTVDILAIAQVSQFEDVRYNPVLAKGNIFGEVAEQNGLSLGVDAGDLIRGNYSLSFDASVFSTNKNQVEVPVSNFNLFVGNEVSFPFLGNFFLPKHRLVPRTASSFIDPNPLAVFIREGNEFVFDTLIASLEYSTSEESNIFAELTGGKPLFGESGEGLLFSSRGGWTTGTTDIIDGRRVTVEGGITQTCEGNGCRFQVPEPTTTLLMSVLALSGGGLFKRKLAKKPQVA